MNESFLPARHAATLSAAIGYLYEEVGEHGAIEHAMDAIEMLVSPSSISVELFLPAGTGVRHLTDRRMTLIPGVAELVPIVLKTHPSVLYLQMHPQTALTRLSDFVTQRELRELALWDCGSKLEGWVDQIAVMCPTAQGVVCFALNRAHVYSDEERLAVMLFQPHLGRMLNRDAMYAHLPMSNALTHREREVLHWLAQGKRDEEIAILLRCGLRTVSQHVRALLDKLGVENRTSAALKLVTNTSLPPLEGIRVKV